MVVSVSNVFASRESSVVAPVSLQDEPDSVATPVVPADSNAVCDSTAQTAPATHRTAVSYKEKDTIRKLFSDMTVLRKH